MWMQYSAQDWPEAKDLRSTIERMSCELDALSLDSLHAANYDMNYCFDNDAVRGLMNDSDNYNTGANLCRRWTHGILRLEDFCEQMVRADLIRFLHYIKEYLPKEIIEKYQLNGSDIECAK